MLKFLSLLVLSIILIFVIALLPQGDRSVTLAAGEPQSYGASPMGAYTGLQLKDGVFRDGQAAFWDVDIFDYFIFFGPPQRQKGHKPSQPIRFSHITHVQQNKMECQYCHWSVNKSPYAVIPEVETCMGCHKLIMGGNPEAQTEIAKIKEYYDKNEPIPWEKVHVMPDHVHFNHKRHVKAGVTCHECHGQVPNMQVVERVSSMKMGWCVDCHRERGASIDCYTCHY